MFARQAHLPTHYRSPADAKYPCILKAARGEYGRGTHIVASAEEARTLSAGPVTHSQRPADAGQLG